MCIAKQITEKMIEESTKLIREKINKCHQVVRVCDLKIMDYLHQIEFGDYKGMYEAWQIIKEIEKVRLIRRNAKDELENLKVLRLNINRSGIKTHLNRTLQAIKEEENILQNRYYNKRVEDEKFQQIVGGLN